MLDNFNPSMDKYSYYFCVQLGHALPFYRAWQVAFWGHAIVLWHSKKILCIDWQQTIVSVIGPFGLTIKILRSLDDPQGYTTPKWWSIYSCSTIIVCYVFISFRFRCNWNIALFMIKKVWTLWTVTLQTMICICTLSHVILGTRMLFYGIGNQLCLSWQ